MFNNTNVLITGGTGSFGTQFVHHVINNYSPSKLIIFSRDELKQYELDKQLKDHPRYDRLRFFIGDIRDYNRLLQATRGVDYIIHAAAMKQVVASEYNPFECIKTNIMGAENLVNAAITNKVKKLVALSTDKAANPINLYGATKLASDKLFVAGNHMSGDIGTRFSVVRYGNVIGSRGSIIPFFEDLVNSGSTSIPITDERMTRFLITLDEGVKFVIQSLERMVGGEIFIPKIPSVKITDLAKVIAPNIKFKVIGIRPGEKLHEIMLPEDDARNAFEFDDYFVITPALLWWNNESYQKKFGGKPVDERFEYRSDTNKVFMSPEDIKLMIKKYQTK